MPGEYLPGTPQRIHSRIHRDTLPWQCNLDTRLQRSHCYCLATAHTVACKPHLTLRVERGAYHISVPFIHAYRVVCGAQSGRYPSLVPLVRTIGALRHLDHVVTLPRLSGQDLHKRAPLRHDKLPHQSRFNPTFVLCISLAQSACHAGPCRFVHRARRLHRQTEAPGTCFGPTQGP